MNKPVSKYLQSESKGASIFSMNDKVVVVIEEEEKYKKRK